MRVATVTTEVERDWTADINWGLDLLARQLLVSVGQSGHGIL